MGALPEEGRGPMVSGRSSLRAIPSTVTLIKKKSNALLPVDSRAQSFKQDDLDPLSPETAYIKQSGASSEAVAAIKALRGLLDEFKALCAAEPVATQEFAKLQGRMRAAVNRVSRSVLVGEGQGDVDQAPLAEGSPLQLAPDHKFEATSRASSSGSVLGKMESGLEAAGSCSHLSAPIPIATRAWVGTSALFGTMEAVVRSLGAERASVFLLTLDPASESYQLISVVTVGAKGRPLQPVSLHPTHGVAGQVFQTMLSVNVLDTETVSEHVYNRRVDQRTGFYTRSVLCMPLPRSQKRLEAPSKQEMACNPHDLVGVVEVLNKVDLTESGSISFSEEDEGKLLGITRVLSSIIDAFQLTGRDVLQHSSSMQELLMHHTRPREGAWCQPPPPVREITRTEADRRFAKARALINRELKKMQAEQSGKMLKDVLDTRALQQQLIYRVGGNRANVTRVQDRVSLREVALYIERIEECWKTSRDKVVELESRLQTTQNRYGGFSEAFDKDTASSGAEGSPRSSRHSSIAGSARGLIPKTKAQSKARHTIELQQMIAAHRREQEDLLKRQQEERELLLASHVEDTPHIDVDLESSKLAPLWATDPTISDLVSYLPNAPSRMAPRPPPRPQRYPSKGLTNIDLYHYHPDKQISSL